ncbi:hypothetical protein N7461_007367 [Penicillium sp. DV-2018c]|nr:hypothetical protein N7461_007367 [Penicillium sp. DV-2018c]
MATPSDQVEPNLPAHTDLVNWVLKHGGTVSQSVRIAQDAPRGVHLQVKNDWPSSIPKETRGYESARGSFPKYGVDFPRKWIDQVGPEETSAFFLMGQFLRGEEGFWYPYLRTLPQPGQLTTPLFFGEEDVDWIQGTGIPEASVERIRIWEGRFDEAIASLEECGFLDCGLFTWELYLWASTIITSRAFSAKVLSGAVMPDDLPEDGISVLLPLIDLPNHRPMAKVEWRAGDENIGLIVLEDVAPGQEVSNNYGPRNNEQCEYCVCVLYEITIQLSSQYKHDWLETETETETDQNLVFMNYGFCIPGNPTDYRIVHLGVKPDSPLGQAKARQLELFPQVAKNAEDHYYIFNPYYPLLAPETPMEHSIFSPALFNALMVMESNVRERKKLQITEDTISITPSYGTNHSLYAALAQISFELIAHSTNLKASAEDLPSHPSNLNETHSQIYRNGQILIDESALINASWCIARGREHIRTQSWEDIKSLLHELMDRFPAGLLSDDVLSRIRVRILERPSLITKNGELFRLGELFGLLLPTEMQESSQKCFQRILAEASRNVPSFASDPQSLFATVICFLAATYNSNSPETRSRLPSRLTRWIAFLIDEYPLPSASVSASDADADAENRVSEPLRLFGEYATAVKAASWAPDDGVDWLTGDSGWLHVKWLQWAWVVAGEEMVMIPLDPFEILKMEGELSLLKQACLYVPHE